MLQRRFFDDLGGSVSPIEYGWPLSKSGYEFMPPLYEGGLFYMPMTLPGVSITKAQEILQVTNRQIMKIPEVSHVLPRQGDLILQRIPPFGDD